MLISVVINSFNYGHLIGRAIESVLNQINFHQTAEIIVVDDGSTDQTADVISRYQFVKYFRQNNLGQAAAINLGLQNASGDIICLLDADDYFYPNKLMAVSLAFEQDKRVGAVYNNYDVVDSAGRLCGRSALESVDAAKLREDSIFWRLPNVQTSGISFKSSLAPQLRIPPSLRICADTYLLLVLPQIVTLSIVRGPLHAYVLHGDNLFQRETDFKKLELLSSTRSLIVEAGALSDEVKIYKGDLAIRRAISARSTSAFAKSIIEALSFVLRSGTSVRAKLRELVKIVRYCLPTF